MDLVLTAIEIGQLAVIKLLFYLFIGLGILLFFKAKKPILFVALIALFLAATYFVLIWESKLTWWGLEGDEIFVTAFLQRVATGQFFSDFFYGNLPPFYPPLYFWLVGGLAFLLQFNGIQAAQLGVTLVLFLTPFLVYFWQKYYWLASLSRSGQNFDKEIMAERRLLLAPALVFIVADWSAVILKPYEFISAVLIVLWVAFLLQDLHFKKLDWKKLTFYIISGGLLFLTFYFWFFPAILALVLFKLFTQTKAKYYFSKLLIIGVFIAAISLPFTLPLVLSYLRLGAENWQAAFFVPEDLNLYLPFLQFSVFGFISLLGLLTMIFYWSRPYVKALAVLLAATYLWQIISLITITFFQAPFMPAKSFLFLSGAALCLAAAYGIGEFVSNKLQNKSLYPGLFVLGWIILATQLLGGSYIDDPAVRQQLVIMKQMPREEFVNLVNELKTVEGIDQMTILASGVPQVSAYLPLNYYISYNAHFSHPAANFSQRYYFISELANSISAQDFAQKINMAPFEPIDALLLFKDISSYPIYFFLDNYPLGGKEDTIKIPVGLIDEKFFAKVFEDDYFVFFKPR